MFNDVDYINAYNLWVFESKSYNLFLNEMVDNEILKSVIVK